MENLYDLNWSLLESGLIIFNVHARSDARIKIFNFCMFFLGTMLSEKEIHFKENTERDITEYVEQVEKPARTLFVKILLYFD